LTRFISKNRNKIALLLSIILIGTAVLGGTLAYIVAKTPSLKNLFIAQHSSSLTITKTVEHPFGEDYTLPEGLAFDFTVDLGEEYKDIEKITIQTSATETDEVKLADGCFEITLKDRELIKILDILDGTEVTVTETLNEEDYKGFSVKKDDYTDETNPNAKTIIIKRGDNKLEFVNVYEPDPVPADNLFAVNGEKEFEVKDEYWTPDKNQYVFTFGLEYKMEGDDEYTKLGGEENAPTVQFNVINTENAETGETTASLSPVDDGNFSFNAMLLNTDGTTIFDEPGTYYFRAFEVAGDDPNIAYDANLYAFEVVVTDEKMDGVLEIGSVKIDNEEVDNKTVDVTFTNEYRTGGSDSVRIDIVKEVQSEAGEKSPAGYTFELWDKEEYENGEENGEDHKPVIVSQPTNELGETSIMITYYGDDLNGEEEFIYILKEVIPDEDDPEFVKGITYDNDEWEITVKVESNDEGTDIDATVNNPKYIEIEDDPDNNTTGASVTGYTPAEPEEIELQQQIPADEQEQNQEQSPVEEEEELPAEEEENTSGEIPEISAADEPQPLSAGIAPVRSRYSLTSEGVNEIDASNPDAGNTEPNLNSRNFEWLELDEDNICEVTFTNVYKPDSVKIPLNVKGLKKLEGTGRTLGANDFSFAMSSDDLEFETDPVKNNADGKFEFNPEVEFKKVGTYEFVIEEVKGNLGGVTYDDTKYIVTVEVTDDNGKLKAEIISVTEDDEWDTPAKRDEDENYVVEFNNTYKAAPTSIEIKAVKKLEGRDLKSGEFSFIIEGKDGTADLKNKSAVNAEDGSITFDEIEFTEAGEYTYTIKEDIPDEDNRVEGMKYDESRFTVTVTVTDDGEGSLKASVAYTKGSSPVNEVEFVNKYTEPSTSPTPTPTPSDGPTPGPGTTPRPDIPVAPDDGSGVPATGDNNKIGLYVTVMIASAAAIAALVFSGRRQKGTAGRSKSKR